MSLSEFSLKLILIFLPGLITFIIVEQITESKEIKTYRFFINSFVLGFLCYLLYYPISVIPFLNLKCKFFEGLTSNTLSLDMTEIFIVTLLSLPVGLLMSFIINRKILDRFANLFKATKEYANNIDDIWDLVMKREKHEWAVVRDIENDLAYKGCIHAFSENTAKDELYLKDVEVFQNSTAEPLYITPALYLPRKRENLTIEFPQMMSGIETDKPLNNKLEEGNER